MVFFYSIFFAYNYYTQQLTFDKLTIKTIKKSTYCVNLLTVNWLIVNFIPLIQLAEPGVRGEVT